MEIQELFPFVCESKACDQEYHDAKGFGEIVKLWGMIYFVNGERSLLGLTCPKCNKTTLKMVESDAASKLLDDLRSPEIGKLFDFNWVIPFSANILRNHALITSPRIENMDGNFLVPEDFSIYKVHLFTRVWTSVAVDTFYNLSENNIPRLLEIENKKGYKVFPRLSEFSSVYHIYDYFLEEISGFLTVDRYAKLVNSILSSRLDFYYQKILRVRLGIEENDSPYHVPNNLTLEEYDQMIQPRWISFSEDVQIAKLYKFQEEYKVIRNKIDFEIIYNNTFINKYCREFYHFPNWREAVLAQVSPDDEFSAPDEASSKLAEFKNDGDEKEIKHKKFSAPSSEDSDASYISQQSELKCEDDEKPEHGPTSISDDSDASKAKMATDQRIDENSPPSSPEIETETIQQEKNGSAPIEQKKVDKTSSLQIDYNAVKHIELESVPEDQQSDDNTTLSSLDIENETVKPVKNEPVPACQERGDDVPKAPQLSESKSKNKNDTKQKNRITIPESTSEDSDFSLEEIEAGLLKEFYKDVEKKFHLKDNYFAKLG